MFILNDHFRPISAGRDWPLYGDEYGRMKFGNMLIADAQFMRQWCRDNISAEMYNESPDL